MTLAHLIRDPNTDITQIADYLDGLDEERLLREALSVDLNRKTQSLLLIFVLLCHTNPDRQQQLAVNLERIDHLLDS